MNPQIRHTSYAILQKKQPRGKGYFNKKTIFAGVRKQIHQINLLCSPLL
jgi:hypothetical protein